MGFKKLLDSLKLSSKDAVVNGEKDSLNLLKKYLHIDRAVEHDLSKIIIQASESNSACLILLLGNVGDGKSHLLSRMWELHSDLLDQFEVRNDATESIYKDRTYLENLNEVFHPYSDAALKNNDLSVKTIIAINLGTLTNFLEVAGDGFSALRNYVAVNHLIDQQDKFTDNVRNDHFLTLNLADYNIFELNSEGANSQIFTDIIDRVTKKSEDNIFYEAYKQTYSKHSNPTACPVKYNYDLLSNRSVQKALINLLIKIILRDKLIISVRLLMNLIYDLIVPPSFSQLSDEEIHEITISSSFKKEFYKNTFSVLLFESRSTSNILKSINQYDPASNTDEHLDEMVIKLSTIANAGYYFISNHLLEQGDFLFNSLSEFTIQQRISLFLRMHYLYNVSNHHQDVEFNTFISFLYDFNVGKKRELLPLYKQISYAIYHWNGTARSETDYIKLDVGRKQSNYMVSQKLHLQFSPMAILIRNEKKLNKFFKTLNVTFQAESYDKEFNLEIDYMLYQLILKINKGYRPNRIDKNVHVKFTQFVNELVKYQSETKELIIEEFNGENRKQFKLSFIPGFDDFQFTDV